MSDAPVLVARDVRVSHGDRAILRGISLEAYAGEVIGVLGPSGAGKSTFFRALVGEIPAAQGSVHLLGDDVGRLPLWARARRGLAYLPQTPSVLWDLSVRENLKTYRSVVRERSFSETIASLVSGRANRKNSADSPEDDDAVIRDLAARVALDDRMEVRAGELSGGERRRLELARALTRSPTVLICDEPFAGVDPRQATRLADMLATLAKEERVAVLLADHHVAEALRVCTRAMLLLDGEVAVEDEPEAFREHPLVVGRYLGSWQRSLPPSS